MDDLSADERPAVPGEKYACHRDVVDAAYFFHRDLAQAHFQPVLGILAPVAGRIDRAWGYRIRSDAFSGKLDSDRLGKRVHAGFANHAVRAEGNVPLEPVFAGDMDDASPLRFLHPGQHGPRKIEGRAQV